jgi:hypothetical protein
MVHKNSQDVHDWLICNNRSNSGNNITNKQFSTWAALVVGLGVQRRISYDMILASSKLRNACWFDLSRANVW